MRRLIPLLLALCLLLCACNSNPEQTEPSTEPSTAATTQPEETTKAPEETTEPTTEPTEATTEPVEVAYRNPLNGEALDAPYVGRIIAVTIDNVPSALPHHGISQADLFFEMFVNDYCTRGFALFSNAGEVESIGPIRSLRYNFTDIALGFDAVVNYASGSPGPLNYIRKSGLDNISVDEGNYAYRDSYRYKTQGYNWEHTMFAEGQSLLDGAKERGFEIEIEDQDFGLTFAEEAVPASGEAASEIEIIYTHKGRTKDSVLKYNAETDQYEFWQYGDAMIDENNDQPEAFRNVIVMLVPVYNDQDNYHVAELMGSGEGYFACGGKVVEIRWVHENAEDSYTFTLADGTPLTLGVGSSYIGIVPTGSPVNFS